jgi:YHS domain-containing protein
MPDQADLGLPPLQDEEPPVPPPEEATAIDPVCGMTVRLGANKPTYDFEGVTYHFCSAGCRAKFATDPAKTWRRSRRQPGSRMTTIISTTIAIMLPSGDTRPDPSTKPGMGKSTIGKIT